MASSDARNDRNQRHSRQADLPRLQTQSRQSNRFSYTMTPAQAHAATFDAPEHNSRPETIFDDSDESPVVAHELATETSPQLQASASAYLPTPTPQQSYQSYQATTPQTAYLPTPHQSHQSYHATTPQTAYQTTPQTAIPYYHTPQAADPYYQPQQIPQDYPVYQSHTPAPEATRYEREQHPQHSYHERKTSYPALGLTNAPPTEQHPAHRASNIESSPPYGATHYSTNNSTPSMHTHTQSHTSVVSPASTAKTGPYGNLDQKKLPPKPLDFYSPYDHAPPTPRTASVPAYTPSSPMGPNSNTFPLSQIPTSNLQASQTPSPPKTFHSSTMAPSRSCLFALFCPCVAYGRVQHRLSQRSKKAEPTDLLGWTAVNGQCGIMALACGFQGLLAGIQRTRVRRAYGIEGDVCGDCIRGCCCCCCTIGLNEREIVGREEERRKGVGVNGYVRTGTLSYMPPPR